jgi:hypothetical protein
MSTTVIDIEVHAGTMGTKMAAGSPRGHAEAIDVTDDVTGSHSFYKDVNDDVTNDVTFVHAAL